MQIFSFTRDDVHVSAKLPFGWTKEQDNTLLYVTQHQQRGWVYNTYYIMVEDNPTVRIVKGSMITKSGPLIMVNIAWSQVALFSELRTAIQVVRNHLGREVAEVFEEHVDACEYQGMNEVNRINAASFLYGDMVSVCTDYSDIYDMFYQNIMVPDFNYAFED